jgi:hypothetical protein
MDLSKNYKWLLIIFGIWPIIDMLLNLQSINLPIVRYVIYTVGTFYIVKLYFITSKNTLKVSFLLKIIFTFTFFWLMIRFVISATEILNPTNNYIALKTILSGEFALFFSFFLANIEMPLQYFKFFLKTTYILATLYLIIGIPLFVFFTADIANQAELFVKYFYLGSVFLLLLFPYQKTKVNIILSIGMVLALLMMLLVARRNVVLYLVSALFFLSLVIIFSKSDLIKKRKPILVAGSVLVSVCALVFVVIMQFNFSLFLERADSGFESREMVFLDFNEDFNNTPIDWYTGRGPFGTYFSMIGGVTNDRPLIENGYYQHILKQGLFFLIPFIILSITASFNGFFRSKNHLSKAAAILIIVNIIDMFGYGLPFLGLKYLNLLIAFGFCFSPNIRNMNDFEIRKIIRL